MRGVRLDISRRALGVHREFKVLQRARCRLLDAVAGSGAFRFDAGVERIQDVARVKFHLIQAVCALCGQICMDDGDFPIRDRCSEKAHVTRRVPPVRHDVAEMKVGGNRFDLCRHNRAIL